MSLAWILSYAVEKSWRWRRRRWRRKKNRNKNNRCLCWNARTPNKTICRTKISKWYRKDYCFRAHFSFWVKLLWVILWRQMIFYVCITCKLAIVRDILRILWSQVWVKIWRKTNPLCWHGEILRYRVQFWRIILKFQIIQNELMKTISFFLTSAALLANFYTNWEFCELSFWSRSHRKTAIKWHNIMQNGALCCVFVWWFWSNFPPLGNHREGHQHETYRDAFKCQVT